MLFKTKDDIRFPPTWFSTNIRKNIEKNFVVVFSRFSLADSACIIASVVMYEPCATHSGPADKPVTGNIKMLII